MSIYRGPGGSGDATNDAASEVLLAVEAKNQAIAAQAAAEAAQAAAETAQAHAETAETNAETAETNAETAEANAETAQAAAEAAQLAAETASDASINFAENLAVQATTLAAGASATVTYDSNDLIIEFGIPRGNTGATGAAGTNGADGKTVLNGTVNPTTEGVNGDFYINTATHYIFGPKASGSWGTGVSLVGPTGATGATGYTGATGNGISSITLTSGNHAPGTTDTYTITFTDATTTTFTVYNGADGTGAVASVTASAPLASSGGANPNLTITQATTSANGYLSSTDWNTFNGKQAALVSGTNIKTINGSSVLGSGDLAISGLPSQTSNAGKFLKTDGTDASWQYLPTVLPILNRAGASVSVSVGNGLLPILNRAGSTVNVAVT